MTPGFIPRTFEFQKIAFQFFRPSFVSKCFSFPLIFDHENIFSMFFWNFPNFESEIFFHRFCCIFSTQQNFFKVFLPFFSAAETFENEVFLINGPTTFKDIGSEKRCYRNDAISQHLICLRKNRTFKSPWRPDLYFQKIQSNRHRTLVEVNITQWWKSANRGNRERVLSEFVVLNEFEHIISIRKTP